MPTYVYRCSKCHCDLEIVQKISADPLSSCPRCHEEGLRRVPTVGGGIVLQGTGWYKSDYCASSVPCPMKKESAERGETSKNASSCSCGKDGCG